MRSEAVKLIIEISKDYYEILKCEVERNLTDYYPFIVIGNGIPLDSNDSDRAEVQAYFAGQTYGWEEGRKALINDLKAEIEKLPLVLLAGNDHIDKDSVMQILDNIGKAESEEK